MSRDRARRRGRDLERRVARALDGLLHPGQAGDVLVLGRDGQNWILEVKYRRGYLLDRKDQLGRWIEQAKTNALRRAKGEKWGLVLYGGRGTELLFLCPLSWVQDLFVGLSGVRTLLEEVERATEGSSSVLGVPEAVSEGEGVDASSTGPEG